MSVFVAWLSRQKLSTGTHLKSLDCYIYMIYYKGVRSLTTK